MPRRKYTHIFFDLDDTLWDFEKNSRHAMQVVYLKMNLNESNVPFDRFFEVYSKHNAALWNSYQDQAISKQQLSRLRFSLSFEELHIGNIDPDQANALYLEEMPRQNQLMPYAHDLLAYLKSKNYHLSIISNGFKTVQNKKLISSGIHQYFEHVFVSEEIKRPKPDPEIFRHALKTTNARKNQSLMIGDNPDTDIKGALNLGIDAILFASTNKPFNSNTKLPESTLHVVHSLREIMQLL